MKFLPIIFAATALATATNPSGTYQGSLSILGEHVSATVSIVDTTHMNFKITGAVTVDCENEVYSYSSGDVNIPGATKSGDCVHDALSSNSATLKSITYDDSADTISVKVHKILDVTLKLTKSGALEAKFFETNEPKDLESYQELFREFMERHKKKYDMADMFQRFNIFRDNVDLIRAHNFNGTHRYHLGLNELADLTFDEFKAQRLGFVNQQHNYLRSKNVHVFASNTTAPDSVDWVTEGAVTPVKNQGQCGSCWAFSTTGSSEGVVKINGGELVSLSEQELVDCGSTTGNNGCNGGLMDYGFEWIIQNGGICTESDYPYTAKKGTCQKSSCGTKAATTIKGYKDVTQKDATQLKLAVAQNPVSIAVEADKSAFQFYSTGVLTSSACGTSLDHGVLIVGYGEEDSTPYWKVKNSWGPSWGAGGYLLIERDTTSGTKGVCGINMQPSYPTV